MSEIPHEQEPSESRILDFQVEEDSAVFLIGAEATFSDLEATIAYLEPDAQRRSQYRYLLLRHAVENRRFFGEPVPTMDDVEDVCLAYYGKEGLGAAFYNLYEASFKAGCFRDTPVRLFMRNEFHDKDDGKIALEIGQLVDEFYGFEE